MRGACYRLMRDLHLYLGLFVSPFVLVFSVSVPFMVHAWLPRLGPERSVTRTASELPIPEGVAGLSGRPLIDALRPALEKAGVHGEVGFVRHMISEGRMILPVTVPGRETVVTITLATRDAVLVTREAGVADALVALHKFPGQHLANIRMNWWPMRLWAWTADATAYLILFLSVSGVYLWYALRSERSMGAMLLLAGAVMFGAMVYALCP